MHELYNVGNRHKYGQPMTMQQVASRIAHLHMHVPRWIERFSCIYDQGVVGTWHFGLALDYEKVPRSICRSIYVGDGSHFGRLQQEPPFDLIVLAHLSDLVP
jgi:hypothetical protein